jgi:hypothetical protein
MFIDERANSMSTEDDQKESNRGSIRSTLVALSALGYRLVRCAPGRQPVAILPAAQHEPLKRLEHDRWLRMVLRCGWAYSKASNRALRLNQNILPFEELAAKVQPLDFVAAQIILARLPELGYTLVKPEKHDTHS